MLELTSDAPRACTHVQVAENAADAAASNPYERMWKVPTTGLLAMFGKIKRFICSIEIPGITRPHPWLSPLHRE